MNSIVLIINVIRIIILIIGQWLKEILPIYIRDLMENVETKKCSRCKRREVVENCKQCDSCLEYSRNYTKTHPESRKAITKNWKERNPDRIEEYNNEQVECPYCKQKYSRKYLWKHKKMHQSCSQQIKE